jgi:hypothetical protein
MLCGWKVGCSAGEGCWAHAEIGDVYRRSRDGTMNLSAMKDGGASIG